MITAKFNQSLLSFVAALALTGAASPALAMLQPAGTFVPSDCGVQVVPQDGGDVRVATVCAGTLTPAAGEVSDPRAVQFRLADGRSIDFRVVRVSNMLIETFDGLSHTVYQLRPTDQSVAIQATLKATVAKDGAVVKMSGSFAGQPFSVPETERMLVIQ